MSNCIRKVFKTKPCSSMVLHKCHKDSPQISPSCDNADAHFSSSS